jgi:hypothetical protein
MVGIVVVSHSPDLARAAVSLALQMVHGPPRMSMCATSILAMRWPCRVTAPLRRMVEIWRGDLGWPAAIKSGSIQLQGPEQLRRAVPKWFPPSQFAPVPRSPVGIAALAG